MGNKLGICGGISRGFLEIYTEFEKNVGRITEEFVWKYCVLVWYYWGTNGDFVGNYCGIRVDVVRTRVALLGN